LNFPKRYPSAQKDLVAQSLGFIFICSQIQTRELKKDVDVSFSSIKYLDYLGFDCLDISIHTKSLSFPAAIEFAVGWTQEFKSYSDILFIGRQGDKVHPMSPQDSTTVAMDRFTYLPSFLPESLSAGF
jgi:hypothetical protein